MFTWRNVLSMYKWGGGLERVKGAFFCDKKRKFCLNYHRRDHYCGSIRDMAIVLSCVIGITDKSKLNFGKINLE